VRLFSGDLEGSKTPETEAQYGVEGGAILLFNDRRSHQRSLAVGLAGGELLLIDYLLTVCSKNIAVF
jgi:hypothetical protein